MWVPIALSRDVPPGITRAVILEGAERAVWRAEDGSVQIWEDRCPHRGMRLSFGFVRGNALNCLYHGWQYAATAQCLRIPAHPDLQVPNTIRAVAFPVAEAGGMIWTHDKDDTALPTLPPTMSLASLAVEASVDTILALCATAPQGDAQVFAAEFEGIVFHLGWHEVSAQKTMLHATTRDAADPTAALVALRNLRARAEQRLAA